MHRRTIAALSVAVFVLTLSLTIALTAHRVTAAETPVVDSSSSKITQMLGGGAKDIELNAEEQQFVDLTNAERRAHGLNELSVAPLLVKVAREKSKEMYDLNYWGHESPVKEKRTAMRRVLFYLPEPPQSMLVGENLAFSTKAQTKEIEDALMKSPTHRKNILHPEYNYIGLGTFVAPDGRFWVTEIFLNITY